MPRANEVMAEIRQRITEDALSTIPIPSAVNAVSRSAA